MTINSNSITITILTDRAWSSGQALHRETTYECGGVRFRVCIKRDSHNFQSYARAERWDGTAWQRVIDLACTEEVWPVEALTPYYERGLSAADRFDTLLAQLQEEAHAICAPSR